MDPNLTVHAHSYGSLAAGTALMDTKTGVVDAAQLHGSPGARATDAHQWNVPYGHMYASANGHDYVAGLGPDNAFGGLISDRTPGMFPEWGKSPRTSKWRAFRLLGTIPNSWKMPPR